MALAKCTECGSEVSDQAWTCWKCGAPVLPDEQWPVVATQQTGKRAKANLAIVAVLMLLGIGSWVAGNLFLGVGLFGLGVVWWLVTRIYARRRHRTARR
jgi:hypothetical protein